MSKPKFDLDLFWTLPRIRGSICSLEGFCAIGSALKAVGLFENLNFDKAEHAIYETWKMKSKNTWE